MKTLEKINLKIKKLSHAFNVPAYATNGSAGMDLYAAVDKTMVVNPMERFACPTGLIFEIPEGFEAQVRARSGLAIKNGVCLANGIGTIDSDYRGEVKVLLINLGDVSFTINRGDRIAQVVLCPVVKANIEVVDDISDTDRSSGGFGSTGIN